MGIDFNNLIKNLGQAAANLQNDKSKIDTKTELNTYVSGWDAIKAKAEAENSANANAVDISALEGDMKSELASLMGAEFGKSAGVENKGDANKPVFSEEEISLENMMALLAPEDGIDIGKLREYNKKPMLSAESESVDALTNAGFDSELVEIMVESTPGAVKYISDAIKSGRAEKIANAVIQDDAEFGTAAEMDMANIIRAHSRLEKAIARVQSNFKELQTAFQAKIDGLMAKYAEAKTEEEQADIIVDLMTEETKFEIEKTKLEAMMELSKMDKEQTTLKPEEE